MIVLLFWLMSYFAHAQDIKMVKITVGDKLESKYNVADLKKIHSAYKNKNYKMCFDLGVKAEKKHIKLKEWLLYISLLCANKHYESNSEFYSVYVNKLNDIWNDADKLFKSITARRLRDALVDSTLVIIAHDLKNKNMSVWNDVEKLLNIVSFLNSAQTAQLYELAGDINYVQKNFTSAKSYYKRSIAIRRNSRLQARIEILSRDDDVKSAIKDDQLTEVIPDVESTSEFDADETKDFRDLKILFSSNKHADAVKAGVKFIKKYPGSINVSSVLDLIQDTYLAVTARDVFKGQKNDVFNEMRLADGASLYFWAKMAAGREYFADAQVLAETAYSKMQNEHSSTEVLLLAGLAAYHSANFKKAKEIFNQLVVGHAGTKSAAEAKFRLGLIAYRDQNFSAALKYFTNFLNSKFKDDFELSSLYWSWRSLQNLKNDIAAEGIADKLIKTYPMSYYGLKARVELQGGKLFFDKQKSPSVSWEFAFVPIEFASWEKFLFLYNAGWIDEAKIELEFLEEPEDPKGKLVFAYLLGKIEDYHKSYEVLNRAFSLNPGLVTAENVKVGYPRPYIERIQKEAKRYGIAPELVLALMKQESSFRTNVKSSAGAMGLMQLMPATAREVASDMKIKIDNIVEDLSDPVKNIQLGTQYLHRRLRYFDGNVPLALGAYNAGIGNIRNWQRERKDLSTVFKTPSSNPVDEMWFDELPWSETSAYIKSILRNNLVYLALD